VSLDPADTATVALAARAQLGECPLWSPTEARLYWEDIDGRAVHRFDPASGFAVGARIVGVDSRAAFGEQPPALARRAG